MNYIYMGAQVKRPEGQNVHGVKTSRDITSMGQNIRGDKTSRDITSVWVVFLMPILFLLKNLLSVKKRL
jgi:hypothetical protein